jgi:hypothetical protein
MILDMPQRARSSCACMYVCMCIHMYVCMYAHSFAGGVEGSVCNLWLRLY